MISQGDIIITQAHRLHCKTQKGLYMVNLQNEYKKKFNSVHMNTFLCMQFQYCVLAVANVKVCDSY